MRARVRTHVRVQTQINNNKSHTETQNDGKHIYFLVTLSCLPEKFFRLFSVFEDLWETRSES
jgi:hypothetical protein